MSTKATIPEKFLLGSTPLPLDLTVLRHRDDSITWVEGPISIHQMQTVERGNALQIASAKRVLVENMQFAAQRDGAKRIELIGPICISPTNTHGLPDDMCAVSVRFRLHGDVA
jgi:hypothetical protein